MKTLNETISTFIGVSHLEYQMYDFFNRKIIWSSGRARKVLGYTQQDFVKLSHNFYETLVHPDDLDAVIKTEDKLVNSFSGEIIESTSRYRKSDGSYIWACKRKTVFERDTKGYPSIICTIAEDITERVNLENALKEKNNQFDEISWKNSHLLRGPVATIIGLVNLIEEKDITSKHNLQVFNLVKQTTEKLDLVVHKINEDTN